MINVRTLSSLSRSLPLSLSSLSLFLHYPLWSCMFDFRAFFVYSWLYSKRRCLLQCVAVCWRLLKCVFLITLKALVFVAVCCSVLKCVFLITHSKRLSLSRIASRSLLLSSVVRVRSASLFLSLTLPDFRAFFCVFLITLKALVFGKLIVNIVSFIGLFCKRDIWFKGAY